MTATEIVNRLIECLTSTDIGDTDADELIEVFALVESNRVIVAELLQTLMAASDV